MANFISEREYDNLDATVAVQYEESLIEAVQREWLDTFPLVEEVTQDVANKYPHWDFNHKLARFNAELELMYNELEVFEFVGHSSQKVLERMYNRLRAIRQRMERYLWKA